MEKYPPTIKSAPYFLHGGDYNPEQWKDEPGIWDEDMRLMKLAHVNVVSLGIFAWSNLEPGEGHFDFNWMDRIMDKLADTGIKIFLATPTGARPAWMAAAYPEVLRVESNRIRNLFGQRHNHCYTSPVYREKSRTINRRLAERYKDHPALAAWHVSNEYSGECHCPLCQEAFRNWLKKKYDNNLDKLNHAWWAHFWSHTITEWSQIESPAPHGENLVHGMTLDWKRFVTDRTVDFMLDEISPLREVTPKVPLTTNMMGTYPGLNYWKFAPHLDFISWDSYPRWHYGSSDPDEAIETSFNHDLMRSLKGGQPFLLLESTPSMTNWQSIAKLKRPGMNVLSSIQAVAHGSDSVMYFQWRKSRGASEKFHGAVVDHVGHENNRVFREVAETGRALEKLAPIVGTTVRPDAAVIYDWENRWAIEEACGPRSEKPDYEATCKNHYKSFRKRGIPVDVINMEQDLSRYKIVTAPMLYMVRPGVGARIEAFVKAGGTFIATYWSGIVDENDLCFRGGFPGPLRNVLGIWSEELDALADEDSNALVMTKSLPGLKKEYEAGILCDLIHTETATVLGVYKEDFYAGRPALTVNPFGRGKAYYIASRNDESFRDDFYGILIDEAGIKSVTGAPLPEGVSAQIRSGAGKEFLFLMNFTNKKKKVQLTGDGYRNMVDETSITGAVILKPYGFRILERP